MPASERRLLNPSRSRPASPGRPSCLFCPCVWSYPRTVPRLATSLYCFPTTSGCRPTISSRLPTWPNWMTSTSSCVFVDFSAWRPILAQRFASHMGPPPFDPVSLGLLTLLGRWRSWGWSTLHTELCHATRGLDYRGRFGFDEQRLPSPSTLRMALNNTSDSAWLQCADSLVSCFHGLRSHPHHHHLARRFPRTKASASPPTANWSMPALVCAAPRCARLAFSPWRNAPAPPSSLARRAVTAIPTPVSTTVAAPPPATLKPVTSTMRATIAPRTTSLLLQGQRPKEGQRPEEILFPQGPTSLRLQVQSLQHPGRPPLHLLASLRLPSCPPTATTTSRPSPASTNCWLASPTSTSAKSLAMLVRLSMTSCATSMMTWVRCASSRLRHHKVDEDPAICLARGYDAQGTPLCACGYTLAPNGHDYGRQTSSWVCRQRCRYQSTTRCPARWPSA